MAATLPGVPDEYRQALISLDADCQVPFATVCDIVHQESGHDALQLLSRLSAEPVAASPLVQTHRGKLQDGTDVAVRVKCPGATAAIAADLRVCTSLTMLYAAAGGQHAAQLHRAIRTVAQQLRSQADFNGIVRRTEALEGKLRTPGVRLQRLLPELCSRRLLVYEWVEGCPLEEVTNVWQLGLQRQKLARRFTRAFAEMLFEHGLLPGNLNSGNMVVCEQPGGGQELVLTNVSHVLAVPDKLRSQWCRLWCAFVLKDGLMAEGIMQEIAGPSGASVLPMLLPVLNGKPARHTHGKHAQLPGPSAPPAQHDPFMKALQSLQALRHVPSEVLEVLRLSSVARRIGAQLGCEGPDRMAIDARHALVGMAAPMQSPKVRVQVAAGSACACHCIVLATCVCAHWCIVSDCRQASFPLLCVLC